MIKYKRILNTVVLMVMCVFVFGSSNVYARDEVDSISYIAENMPEILEICTVANAVAGDEILEYSGSDGLLSFSNKKYSSLDMDVKNDFMETALLLTKESNMGSQIKNKVYNFIANQDSATSAAVRFLRSDASTDFVSAAALFKPFGGAIGTALGFLALAIFMFIGFSILFDIAYLSLPLFRLALEKDRGRRPKYISREAYSAAIDSEESIRSGHYEGSLSLYFKRRIPAIILISVAVGYLISGQLYDLVSWFIDSFSFMFS